MRGLDAVTSVLSGSGVSGVWTTSIDTRADYPRASTHLRGGVEARHVAGEARSRVATGKIGGLRNAVRKASSWSDGARVRMVAADVLVLRGAGRSLRPRCGATVQRARCDPSLPCGPVPTLRATLRPRHPTRDTPGGSGAVDRSNLQTAPHVHLDTEQCRWHRLPADRRPHLTTPPPSSPPPLWGRTVMSPPPPEASIPQPRPSVHKQHRPLPPSP